MEDEGKTKKQLISELVGLRQLVAALNGTETDCKRAQESLRRREAILQAIAYAAERFLTALSWEDDVDLVLAQLGQAAEVSRVYVFENHTDAAGELLASQRYEWVASGVTAQLDNPDMRGISWRSRAMRRAAEILGSGGFVSGHVKDFLPAEQEMMSAQNIQSMVVVPIFADGGWWGFMGFDECVREREWSAAEIDALKAGVSTLGAAIHGKRSEEALRESEKKYMTMIEYSNDMIWALDKKGNFIYFNNKSEEITGYKIKEGLNKGFMPIILEEDLEMVYDVFRRTLQGKPLRYEVRIHDSSRKKLITLSVNTAPIYKDKEIIGTVSFGRDITERKRADEVLKKSEARLAEAQHTAHLGEWEWDIVKHEVHWSTELYRIFDVDPDELKPSRAAFLERVHPDDRPYLEECIAATLSNKEPFSVDHRITLPSGTIRYLHSETRMEWDAANKPVRLVGIAQDITERKQAEEALRKSYTEIEQLKDRLQAESEYLRAEIKLTHSHVEIVGESEAIKKVLHQVEQVAPTESLALITGETGTGKELIARAIHNLSKRKDRVMVKVDCASLPSTLVESELFGRQKGAYTGALTSQVGRFEVADGSSIFLDEIGELSTELQVKLLRVVHESEFERLGSPKTIQVNVRVIAATNRDLSAEVRKGNFREDLYYRLNVFHIEVPPLRERLDDIPLLVWTFVNEFAEKMGKKIQTVPKRTMEALQRYHWPGNVRELRNVIEHAVIVSTSDILKVKLPQDPRGVTSRILTMEDAELQHITKVLDRTNWRIKGPHGAAELLGLKPSTLYTRMNKLGIPTSRNKDVIPT